MIKSADASILERFAKKWKYIATDYNGYTYMYTHKPKLVPADKPLFWHTTKGEHAYVGTFNSSNWDKTIINRKG